MLGNGYCVKLYLIGCILLSANLLGRTEGDEFQLRLPPRPARIYTQAPANVKVTVVRATYGTLGNESFPDNCEVRYRLEERGDFELFTISECDGSIETAELIQKEIGEGYYITVVATRNDSDDTATREISIEVTPYNKGGPTLTHSHYSQEILDVAPIGTTLMALNGSDEHEGNSNETLYYFIQSPSASGLNPWLYPTRAPLKIDYISGEIKVSAVLFDLPESMLFYIGVADAGSPQRSQTSKLTLHVRNMSAPRNLKVFSTSEHSINICWSSPIIGTPDGYRITYNTRKNIVLKNTDLQGLANVTVKYLYESGQVFRGHGSERQKIDGSMDRSDITNLTYCSSIEGLKIFTFYIVKLAGWSTAGRLSMTSSPLAVVTKKRDCSEELCNKGICQEQRSPPGYKCICIDGYTGPHCEKFDRCSANGLACQNGICKWSDDSPARCECHANFFGDQCQWESPCSGDTCQNSGKCIAETPDEYHCSCPPLYTGTYCEIHLEDVSKLYSDIDGFCSNETTVHGFGNITWPETYIGKEISVNCWANQNADAISENAKKQARRKCQRDPSGKPFWEDPITDFCILDKGSKSAAERVKNVGRFLNLYKSQNLSNVMLKSAIQDMSRTIKQKFSKDKGKEVAKVLNSLLKINKTKLHSSKEFRQSARSLFKVFNTFTENIDLQVGESFSTREESFFMSAKVLRRLDLPAEISFQTDNTTLEKIFLRIPKSAVSNIIGEEIRFQFVSFVDDRIFVDNAVNVSLDMPVLSVSVGNESITNIDPPVTYNIFRQIGDNHHAICVFWDEIDNSWSSNGIRTVLTSDGGVLCESSHLTAFSVLLDPIHTDIGYHSKILSIITYIGLAISTVALVITVATFALFRSLRKDRSGMIVVNLSIALLLLNFCFVLAVVLPGNQMSCLFFAVLLHYGVVSTFAWMLIEAINMHQLLITVFPSVETHFLLKRLFFGWVCPAFFIGLALLWDHQVYVTDNVDICVISSSNAPIVYYTTYLVPIVLVLTVNCVIFGLVTKVLCQARPESSIMKYSKRKIPQKKSPVTLAQIRGAITVIALLGITWTNGAFAIGSTRIIFQYIFCITTPLQGFIIFLVRVVQHAEARSLWYRFIFYDMRSRTKLPQSSLRSHSSYQNVSSLNTQSTNSQNTPKSVFTSAALRAARRLSSTGSNYLMRNRGSSKDSRRCSSPTLKDNKDMQQAVVGTKCKLDNKISCITKENDSNKIINALHPSNQCDNIPLNSRSCLDGQPEEEKIIHTSNKDSYLKTQFENNPNLNLFSNDVATTMLSNIHTLQRELSERMNKTKTKEDKLQGKSLLKNMAVVFPKTNFGKTNNLLKVNCPSLLHTDIGEFQNKEMKLKSRSLNQIENFNNSVTAPNYPPNSNLMRFFSENMLDKL